MKQCVVYVNITGRAGKFSTHAATIRADKAFNDIIRTHPQALARAHTSVASMKQVHVCAESIGIQQRGWQYGA